jgi:hypothetical protein
MSEAAERIITRVRLPYLLLLPDGNYPTGQPDVVLTLSEVVIHSGNTTAEPSHATVVEMASGVPASLDDAAAEKVRMRRANQLLLAVNQLIRWYRATSNLPQIVELTRAQLSPFHFFDTHGSMWRGMTPLVFTSVPPLPPAGPQFVADAVARGLASGDDPSVASLNLLDAEYAVQTGRFREAILLCWGVIDSVFSMTYGRLARSALAGEWAESVAYLSEFEIPLKVRMSAMMHLVANRSLFREPELWQDLVRSYDKRNAIIHRGASATEDDATRAIDVARKVVGLMQAL